MHVGLIGGIGPASTEYYYRLLVNRHSAVGKRLALTIANADARELVGNMKAGNASAQAECFAAYVKQLRAGGCEAVALTSMGAHFCIKELEAISALPILSAIPALESHFRRMGTSRIGVLGTSTVMESRLCGIRSVEVIVPRAEKLAKVHSNYIGMALAGAATDDHRQFFLTAGLELYRDQGAEVVVLGGTDLCLVFKEGDGDYGFPIVDSALIHAEAIARVAMGTMQQE
jgi:aspartate racemase